jgi:hypothetical protein
MPVSKKRKKDGKPVHHREPIAAGSEHDHGPGAKVAGPPQLRPNKPSNPFVANKTQVRSAQRGR